MSAIDELLELEHAGWRSLCEGTGAAFYSALMTDAGVMVLADGSVLQRDGVAASLQHAPVWSSYTIVEPRELELSDDTAALRYTGVGRRDGEDDFVARMTSVYVRDGADWRLAIYQQTPAP